MTPKWKFWHHCPHVVPNPSQNLSSVEHKRRYLKNVSTFEALRHSSKYLLLCFTEKYTVPFNMYKETVHCVCILDLGLTAENCSRRLLFIAVHTQFWPLWVVFVCMCLRESTHHPFGVGNGVWRLVKEKQSPSPSFITNMHLESCRALW